ncbi:putative muramidase, partial [Dactylonectria estremocensis]
ELGFNILKSEITGPEFHDSVWGLVIYRCVEGNDAAWERMLEAIRKHVSDYLEHHPRKDLKDLAPFHDLHVIDDKALYGARIHKLREHFKTWAPKNLESRLGPDSTSTVTDVISTAAGSTPRYNFFLAVDESDVLLPDNPDLHLKSPLLKLVSLQWDCKQMFQTTHPYFLEGFVELDEEDGGWAEVYLSDYVDIYNHLQRIDWDD